MMMLTMALACGWLYQFAAEVVVMRSFTEPLFKRADNPVAYWTVMIIEAAVIGFLGWYATIIGGHFVK